MTPAGPEWVKQFPTSTSLDDLAEPFQSSCRAFIGALEGAGAKVTISATYRPPERAWLMHHCCMIAMGKEDPASVPPMTGVDIQWQLDTPADTLAACSAMMRAYRIVFPAALVSRHTQKRAIDMTIVGSGVPYGEFLYRMGASFGVIKLESDPPHWSSDGH